MNESEHAANELDMLLEKLCEHSLAEVEQTRLNELLRQSEELCDRYLTYMQMHAALAGGSLTDEGGAQLGRTVKDWESLLEKRSLAPPLNLLVIDPEESGLLATDITGPEIVANDTTTSHITPIPWILGSLAGIVCLLTIAGIFIGSAPQTNNPASDDVEIAAQLKRTVDCQWAESSADSFLGENLTSGQYLNVQSGLVELQFQSGARVILQGPAEFEVLTGNSGWLHAGTLTANVPDSAHGFTIRSPAMEVIDLGTEFAISTDGTNHSELHVLSGKVKARLRQSEIGASEEKDARELVTGQALSIESPVAREIVAQEIDAVPDQFIRTLPGGDDPKLPPPLDTSLTWIETPRDQAVIHRGSEGAWDHLRADNAFVFVEHDKLYCFYKGRDKPEGLGGKQRIGVAMSVDGIHWVKLKDGPVLDIGPKGAWDSEGVKLPMVFCHEGTYYLYYSGLNGKVKQIGVATSIDLLHWTKHPANPILSVQPESWDCQLSTHPTPVFRMNDRFYMLFRGMKLCYSRQGVGLAVSNDLLNWKRAKHWPVISCDEEIYSFGGIRTSDGFVAMAHAEGEPFWHSKDLFNWRKGNSAQFDQPWVDTVSRPFYWKGHWNVLYERKDQVYRAILGGVVDRANKEEALDH